MSWDSVDELFQQDELSLLQDFLPVEDLQAVDIAPSSAPEGFPHGLDLAPSVPTFAEDCLPVNFHGGSYLSPSWQVPGLAATSAPLSFPQEQLGDEQVLGQNRIPLRIPLRTGADVASASAILPELPSLPSAGSSTLLQNRARFAGRPRSPESSHRPRIYSRPSVSTAVPVSGTQAPRHGGHIVRQGSTVPAAPAQQPQPGRPRIVTGQSANPVNAARARSGDAVHRPSPWLFDQEASSGGAARILQADLGLAGPSIRSQAFASSSKARRLGDAMLAMLSASTGTDAVHSALPSAPSQAAVGMTTGHRPAEYARLEPGMSAEDTARLRGTAMPALVSPGGSETAGSSISLPPSASAQAAVSRGVSFLQLLEADQEQLAMAISAGETGMISMGPQLSPAGNEQMAQATGAGPVARVSASLQRPTDPASSLGAAARLGFAMMPMTPSPGANSGATGSSSSLSLPGSAEGGASRSTSQPRLLTTSMEQGAGAQPDPLEILHRNKRSRAMSPSPWQNDREVARGSWVQSALTVDTNPWLMRYPQAEPPRELAEAVARRANILSELSNSVAQKAGTELFSMRNLKSKLKAEAEELMKRHDRLERREHGVLEVLQELSRLRQSPATAISFEKQVLELVDRLDNVRLDRPPAAARLGKDLVRLSKNLAHRLNNEPPGRAWKIGPLAEGGLLMSTALGALDADNLQPHSLVLSNSSHAGRRVTLTQLRSLPPYTYHELAMNYMMDVGSALMKMGGGSEDAQAAQQQVARLMVEAMTITYVYGVKDPRNLLGLDPLLGGEDAGNDPQVWKRAVATAGWTEEQVQRFWTLWDEYQAKIWLCKTRAESLRMKMREEHCKAGNLEMPATTANWELVNAAVELQQMKDEHALLLLAFGAICTLRVNTPLQLGIMGAICAPALVRYDKMVEAGALVRPSRPQLQEVRETTQVEE